MVPEGWTEFKIEKLVKATQLGTSLRGVIKGEESSGIPLIKMGNLTWGGFNFNKVEVISPEQIDEALLLEHGDFLFNTRNTPKLVGKSAVWDGPKKAATFDNNINRINFNKLASPFFMAYLLNHGTGKAKVQSLPAGSTSVAAIYWKDLKNLKLSLPPLAEQKKIAQILSTWDKAIITTEQLLDNSQQQKKALMQQLLTGRKRLLDENGVRFSGEWRNTAIRNLFSRVTTKNQGQSENVVTISGQLGLINQREFFSKSVASKTLDNYTLLRKGQFAYNKSYSNGYPMGAIKRLNRYEMAVVTTLYICFEIQAEEKAYSDFWEQYFEAGLLNQGLSQVAHEGGRAHGLLNVKPADFFGLKVPLPSINEQTAIGKVLAHADKDIRSLSTTVELLKSEKKALMQQLLTGKRRVKEAVINEEEKC